MGRETLFPRLGDRYASDLRRLIREHNFMPSEFERGHQKTQEQCVDARLFNISAFDKGGCLWFKMRCYIQL